MTYEEAKAVVSEIMEDRNMGETRAGHETLLDDIQRLRKLADSAAAGADRALAERNTSTALAVSHADLCTKLVHVDSIQVAVDLLTETALSMERVDTVAVWVERAGKPELVSKVGELERLTEADAPTKDGRAYDLAGLSETRRVAFPDMQFHYPVPIFHPGNGVVGVAEYASTSVSDFPQVLRRVLCGITDTVATVVGRLTVCERLAAKNMEFQAISRASMEAIAVFEDGELFASNQMFDLMVSDSQGNKLMGNVEAARALSDQKCQGQRARIAGYDVVARSIPVTINGGRQAVAVVLTLWKEREK